MILDSKVIICAGGDGGKRWNKHLGITKHMIPAHGEPLVHRIQRQLLEKGFTNVHLACSPQNKKQYLLNGVNYIASPPLTGHIGDKLCSWHYRKHIDYQGTTVILFADVYYTDELIDVISKDANDMFKIYGRADSSTITKNHRQGEPFAVILHKDWLSKFYLSVKQTMSAIPQYIDKGIAIPEDLAKYTYRKIVGIPYEAPGNVVESKHWFNWDDLSDDFDDIEDWDIKSRLFPHIFYKV